MAAIVIRWQNIGDDKVPAHFRLVIKTNPKIERLCFDELGAESWRPALHQANKTDDLKTTMIRVLAEAVPLLPGSTNIIDLGVLK